MYISIDNNKVLRKEDIVGIFDMDSSTVSLNTRKFLSEKQKEKMVIPCGFELPKSFIITRDGNVYLSQYNSSIFKD
jgi:hypothetical protein